MLRRAGLDAARAEVAWQCPGLPEHQQRSEARFRAFSRALLSWQAQQADAQQAALPASEAAAAGPAAPEPADAAAAAEAAADKPTPIREACEGGEADAPAPDGPTAAAAGLAAAVDEAGAKALLKRYILLQWAWFDRHCADVGHNVSARRKAPVWGGRLRATPSLLGLCSSQVKRA